MSVSLTLVFTMEHVMISLICTIARVQSTIMEPTVNSVRTVFVSNNYLNNSNLSPKGNVFTVTAR